MLPSISPPASVRLGHRQRGDPVAEPVSRCSVIAHFVPTYTVVRFLPEILGPAPDPPGARSCPIRNATAVAPRNSSSTSGLPTGDNRADTVPRNKRHELILGFGPGQPMWGYRIQGKLLLQTARKRRVIGARASFSPSKRFGDPGCSQRHGGTALLYVARYSARPR